MLQVLEGWIITNRIDNKFQFSAEDFNKKFGLTVKDNELFNHNGEPCSVKLNEGYKVTFEETNVNLYQFKKILTDKQKQEIKVLHAKNLSLRKIANIYNVSHTTISRALKENK